MWLALIPLTIGCAIVPTHLLMTVLMLQAPRGRATALAFFVGMLLMRLVQGAILATLVDAVPTGRFDRGTSAFTSVVLVAVGMLLIVGAIRALLVGDDGETPERWVKLTSHLRPRTALPLGAAVVLVSMRFWVLTFAAVAVIRDADLGEVEDAVVFLVFVLASLVGHLALIGAASVTPGGRTDRLLTRLEAWFRRHRAQLIVLVGFGFGGWLLLKGLLGLGVL